MGGINNKMTLKIIIKLKLFIFISHTYHIIGLFTVDTQIIAPLILQ